MRPALAKGAIDLKPDDLGSRRSTRCQTQTCFEAAKILSPLHRHGQLDFTLASEECDSPDLPQVHPDRVVKAGTTGILSLGRAARLGDSAALLVIAGKMVGRRRSIETESVIAERRVRNLTKDIGGWLGKVFQKLVERENVSICRNRNRKTDFRCRGITLRLSEAAVGADRCCLGWRISDVVLRRDCLIAGQRRNRFTRSVSEIRGQQLYLTLSPRIRTGRVTLGGGDRHRSDLPHARNPPVECLLTMTWIGPHVLSGLPVMGVRPDDAAPGL